jgi:SAM-dependent methyltransferase
MNEVRDRAGRNYWNHLWADAALPIPVDPRDTSARNYLNRRFAAYFNRSLRHLPGGSELLEVGCARSEWLPHFARDYPFRVSGLDYSEGGCRTAREVLRRAGQDGTVICGDLFSPPSDLVDRFNAVVSIGVVEHFQDTAATIEALGRLLKPGGRLLTVIPNMAGLVGTLQRRVNRPVYDIHVPLTAEALAAAHNRAGLRVDHAGRLLAVNFGVVNLNGLPDTRKTRTLERIRGYLGRASKLVWLIENRTRPLPASRALSPYVVCSAHRV